jgi:hypothetical protein
MRTWMLRASPPAPNSGGVRVLLLVGTLLGALSGCGHNPNHDIDREKARAAASRVHTPPKPGEKRVPGHGG